MTTQTGEFITVVSGLPRSGTSMMMRMLEKGGMPVLADDVRHPDQDNPNGYYELEQVKKLKTDKSWVSSANGKVFKAIYVHLYELPIEYTYRVIFMQRNLEEVVASQNVMLQRQGKAGGSLSTRQIIAIFQKRLTELGSWLQTQPNMDVLYVPYSEVLQNPTASAHLINQFLGSQLDVQAMAATVDSALYRQKYEMR